MELKQDGRGNKINTQEMGFPLQCQKLVAAEGQVVQSVHIAPLKGFRIGSVVTTHSNKHLTIQPQEPQICLARRKTQL